MRIDPSIHEDQWGIQVHSGKEGDNSIELATTDEMKVLIKACINWVREKEGKNPLNGKYEEAIAKYLEENCTNLGETNE